MASPKPTPPAYSEGTTAQHPTLNQIPLHAPFLDSQQSPHQAPLQGPYQPQQPIHGPLDNSEVAQWNQHPDQAIATPSRQLHESSVKGPDPGKWHAPYCGFCSPIDLSLITWCLPCLTFGQTHHRLRWGGNMESYEPLNSSVIQKQFLMNKGRLLMRVLQCCVFCAASCFGVHWIPMMMQRSDLREKYGIEGNCCGDCCSAFCCPVCDLVQAEKEVKFREGLKSGHGLPVAQQYVPQGGMSMPTPVYQPATHK